MSKIKTTKTRTTKRISVRQALIAAIARDVGWLIEHDRFRDLELVMEATGYMGNRTHSTSHKEGSAIIALSSVIERSWLEGTASSATFYRHYTGSRNSTAWSRAHARADQTLRDAGVDVDARNAKQAREEEEMMAEAACRREQAETRVEAVH